MKKKALVYSIHWYIHPCKNVHIGMLNKYLWKNIDEETSSKAQKV